MEDEKIRINRYLALCGVSSRRRAEELVLNRRVTVNGKTITSLSEKIGNDDIVKLDSKICSPEKNFYYFALNKPAGYICSRKDPEKRPDIYSLLAGYQDKRLFSIGRLDFLSSGLILITNDGNFSKIVSHPSNKFEKDYIVQTNNFIETETLEEFKKGIIAEGVLYKIQDYKLLGRKKVKLTLIEGKNREIRNLFRARNLKIKSIHRIRIGTVRIENLDMGAFRKLKNYEIEWFLNRGKNGSSN